MPDVGVRHPRRDRLVCGVLMAASALYVAAWPRDLYGFDEGMFLYEIKRVLDGDLMYRDFFQIAPPLWFYAMAGIFAVFGASIETARATMAVVHPTIVGLTYMIGRRVGLPWTIAALLGVLHLTLGYPASTITTPHWFGTLLYLLIAALVMRMPCATTRRALGWGVMVGVLTLVQHQKGAVIAVGLALIALHDLRAERVSIVAARLLAYAFGIAVTFVPVMLGFVLLAGFDNVWDALVRYPLINYPRIHQQVPWGFYIPGLVPAGFVVQCIPVVIPLAGAIVLWRSWIRGHTNDRRLIVLLILSFVALLSVLYNRNYFHFALAAPLWFLLAGALLAPYAARGSSAKGRVSDAIALILIGLCVVELWQRLRERHIQLPVRVQTAFGGMDVANAHEGEILERLSIVLHNQAGNDIFVYPANPGLYLVVGLHNPTRYQIALPSYTDRRALEEIIGVLERRQVPFVVNHAYPGLNQMEPLTRYLQERYELAEKVGGSIVYRRKGTEKRSPLF